MVENDQQHVDTSTSSSMAPIPLPQLEKLQFYNCQNLRCILLCPNLEDLVLFGFNEELQIITQSQNSSSSYLRVVKVTDVAWLNSLSVEVLQGVAKMGIYGDSKIKNLGEVGLLFRSNLSSIKSLSIIFCSELTSVWCGGLEHLTTLDDLTIDECDELRLSGEEAEERVDDNGMPCPSLPHSLRKLNLIALPKLVHLPNWMQSLAALKPFKLLVAKDWNHYRIGCRNSPPSGNFDSTVVQNASRKDANHSMGKTGPTFNTSPSLNAIISP